MLTVILNKPTALVVLVALGCRDYLSFSNVDSIVKRPSEYLGYKLIAMAYFIYSTVFGNCDDILVLVLAN